MTALPVTVDQPHPAPGEPFDPDRWWTAAACRHMDPDLFYPVENVRTGSVDIPLEVRLACDACPVSSECLEHALRHEDHGIWANTSPEDRRRLRRTLRIRVRDPEALTPPPPGPEAP